MVTAWVYGVDLNAYRHPVDFAVLAQHKRFAVIRVKGSENGPGEIDARCAQWYGEAVAAGMDVGVYGFARWSQDPVEWANEFADACFAIGWGRGDGRPWLDIEAPHAEQTEELDKFRQMPAEQRCLWVELAVDVVEQRFDRRCLIYGSPYKWREWRIDPWGYNRRGLVFPRYSGVPGDITYNGKQLTVAPWPYYVAHQYSSTGQVPGITGNVDLVAVRPEMYASVFLTREPRR